MLAKNPERNVEEDLDMHWVIILNWILKESDVREWN
jgi:hypothetical protein